MRPAEPTTRWGFFLSPSIWRLAAAPPMRACTRTPSPASRERSAATRVICMANSWVGARTTACTCWLPGSMPVRMGNR